MGTGPLKKTVEVVLWRAEYRCERCGERPYEQIHHRKPRGMGGSRNDPGINLPSNLICLCRVCHEWVERNRETSYEHGWLVRREHSPSATPVLVCGQKFVCLDDAGNYRVESEAA